MSCEIELKAHIADCDVDNLVQQIKKLEKCKYLGKVDKYDIYWSDTEDGEPKFRTRLEHSSDGERVLFTQKPLKSKDYCTEYNVENEFETDVSQWQKILEFLDCAGLKKCRIKEKNGYHFIIELDNFEMHCEVLNVKYLGWFIETEICGNNLEQMDTAGAEKALYHLLDILKVDLSAVEPKGYNKLLRAVGHEKG